MKILIKVTKEVLQRSAGCGSNYSSNVGSNCAIAVAVLDFFPNAWVSDSIQLHKVDYPTWSYVNEHSAEHIIILPLEAQDFIDDFDACDYEERLQMNPISFEIDVPDNVIQRIGIGQAYKVLSESKTLELVSI